MPQISVPGEGGLPGERRGAYRLEARPRRQRDRAIHGLAAVLRHRRRRRRRRFGVDLRRFLLMVSGCQLGRRNGALLAGWLRLVVKIRATCFLVKVYVAWPADCG